MRRVIEITINSQGETSLQTKGFSGSSCREALYNDRKGGCETDKGRQQASDKGRHREIRKHRGGITHPPAYCSSEDSRTVVLIITRRSPEKSLIGKCKVNRLSQMITPLALQRNLQVCSCRSICAQR